LYVDAILDEDSPVALVGGGGTTIAAVPCTSAGPVNPGVIVNPVEVIVVVEDFLVVDLGQGDHGFPCSRPVTPISGGGIIDVESTPLGLPGVAVVLTLVTGDPKTSVV